MRDYGKTTKVKKYADGGAIGDKELGLERSSGDKVGFWDRITAGNIDNPNSRAYREFGAGRGKVEKEMDSFDAATKAAPKTAPTAVDTAVDDDMKTAEELGATSRSGNSTSDMSAKRVARDMPGASGESVGAKGATATTVKAPKQVSRASDSAAGGFAAGLQNGAEMAKFKRQQAEAKSATKSGIGPENTMNTRAYAETEKRKTASNPTGSIYGMANGGMVGGNRSYGKKC